jgi:hypothetical protein
LPPQKGLDPRARLSASIDELKRKSEYLMRGLCIDPKSGRLLDIGEDFSEKSSLHPLVCMFCHFKKEMIDDLGYPTSIE